MDYHSPGSPGTGGSNPDLTDLSRRLPSMQQAQQATEYGSEDDPTLRSRPNTDQRTPASIQCCCGKENCKNFAMFLKCTGSMEDELRLAAEVGQALLQKHEIYQKEVEELQRSLNDQTEQCTHAEQKVQEYENMVRGLEESLRVLTLERDEALKQKKIDAFTEAIDSRDNRILELTRELERSESDIKRLTASNLKGEKSEEREEILGRQLEDLKQELAIARKSEHAAELNVKKLKENLKLEQIEIQKSKVKLEAVAMLREMPERREIYSSTNNEANSHLINLIKELSSANNKLKLEIGEYRDLLFESRNEVSALQARIEDMETASATGYPYQASYTSGSFASPFNRNFPPHVLDDAASVGESASHTGCYTEEAADGSNILPGIGDRPIHPHMSPSVLSSSFGPGSYNTFNSMGVDASTHSPAGSVVSSSVLSKLEKYLMKKTKHKGSGRIRHSSLKKGKKMFVEISEEDEEQIKPDDAQSDTAIRRHEKSDDYSDCYQSYSGESEGDENPTSEKNESHKSDIMAVKIEEKDTAEVTDDKDKGDNRQGAKKKARSFSQPAISLTAQKQAHGVSLLSAGLKRSVTDKSDVEDKVQDDENKTVQARKPLGKKGTELKLASRRSHPPLILSKRPSTSKLSVVASTSKQHRPSQPSPLAVHHAASAAESSLSVKVSQSSGNSPMVTSKSKVISSEKPLIPAFKNPKFATLGPKERKQMMEAWRADVAKEQQKKNGQIEGNEAGTRASAVDNSNGVSVKGKNRKSDSPIKAFVEEVLVDEANLSAAEAAALADEVEHGLSSAGARSVRSRRTSTATRHTSLHVPPITISIEEPKDLCKSEPSPQQNPYQSLYNLASHIMDRMKGTDLLALNRRLKRAFDILELTDLSNNLIESILNDVEIFRDRFRWVEDLRNNEEIKPNDKDISDDNSNQKDLYSFSPENFLPLVHLLQDLLSEIGKLRMMVNDLQVSYVQKVEESRRKSEEEFDKSMMSGKNDGEMVERRDRSGRVQSSDGGIGAYLSRVFGVKEVQSPPSSTRHHSRRLSVDFSHDRDVSVASIDTFAEDYYTDRNIEVFTSTPNALRASKRENNETTVSFLRQQVVSLFGGGGNNSFASNEAAEKSGNMIEASGARKKYATLPIGHSGGESRQTRRVASLDSGGILHNSRQTLVAERKNNASSPEENINVQDINDYLGDFLQTSQPTYDPATTENIGKENSRIRRIQNTSPSPTISSKLGDFVNSLREIFDDPIGTLRKIGTKPPAKKVEDILHDDHDKVDLETKRQRILNKKDIKDMGQVFLDRKKEIYDASLINCAELHSELTDCFRKGSLRDRLTFCHGARDKFWNCMEQQKKLLYEMGYKTHNKTDNENEEILSQADIRFQQEFAKG
ncbi:2240_t:CDS:10 [Acaulospora colombiana]|uniref:2240_t:CDS:1 n=1 Tax=Acaulospora colombiana TaxID=27376 RepID=A0ACA9K1C2_9GLOM|nr:2240_t:CDS:10 [Acaulospora colombiana]